MRVFS